MKIFIVGPKWHGKTVESIGAAALRLGHEYCPFHYIDAFRGFKQNAIQRRFNRISPYPFLLSLESWRMNRNLINEGLRFKPDLIILLHANLIFPFMLRRVKALTRAKIVNWVIDEPLSHPNIVKSMPLYDHFFCFDRYYLEVIAEISGIRGTYLPCACNPELHKPIPLQNDTRIKYGADISFVGTYYNEREVLFRKLVKICPDLKLKIWGPGWKERLNTDTSFSGCLMGPLSVEQFPVVSMASRINLNIHHGQSLNGGANMRTFELACMGAFQLVDHIKGIEELFLPEQEMVVYNDVEDLGHKIKFYLSHPQACDAIAKKAMEKALGMHTYEHRLKEILDKVYR